jgi:hypothetical protein
MTAMKKDKTIYWVTTIIIATLMLWSAYNFAFGPTQADAFRHLGLPNWFRWELTVAKALGGLAILVPLVPGKVKEFAYFGFGLTLVSASIAHLSSGDSAWFVLAHATFFGILLVSYAYRRRLTDPERLADGRNERPRTGGLASAQTAYRSILPLA